jgi:L-threonylcarbamoyladenylate synthase
VTAEHVYDDFGDKIPLILNGGRCEGGIESTVLDITGEIPVILRKGLITVKDIKEVVGKCEYARDDSQLSKRSPGTKYRHYKPKTETAFFLRDDLKSAVELYRQFEQAGKKPYFMCDGEIAEKLRDFNVLNLGNSGAQMANRLYYLLHEGEKNADIIIGIALKNDDELILSVNNRFLKAFA